MGELWISCAVFMVLGVMIGAALFHTPSPDSGLPPQSQPTRLPDSFVVARANDERDAAVRELRRYVGIAQLLDYDPATMTYTVSQTALDLRGLRPHIERAKQVHAEGIK